MMSNVAVLPIGNILKNLNNNNNKIYISDEYYSPRWKHNNDSNDLMEIQKRTTALR